MPELAAEAVSFLAWSSLQVLVLGHVVMGLRRLGVLRAGIYRLALGLVVVLPVLSLATWLLPAPTWLTIRSPLLVRVAAEVRPTSPSPAIHAAEESRTEAQGMPMAVTVAAPSVAAPGPASASVDPRVLLGAFWAAGLLVALVRVGRDALVLRALLGESRAVRDPHVRSLLRASAASLGVPRLPRLAVCDRRCGVPFLVGVLNPVIVVPRRLLAPDRRASLHFALLHELSHLRHRDHWWVLPEALLRAAYFFHPIVGLALSRLQEERECRADRVVARVSARRAAYADFLLDEIESTRSRMPPTRVVALGRGPGSMVRRIHHLLQRGETTMPHFLRNPAAVTVLGAALLCLLGVAAGPVSADDVDPQPFEDPRFGNINAVATDTKGVFRVYPVFEELVEVSIIPKVGPFDAVDRRRLAPATDYTFDATTGLLRFSVPVDPETDHVSVRGYRVLPWRWNLGRPFAPGSVRVELAGQEGKRGVDYEVDEAAGTILFLKREICHREQKYSIAYQHPADPKNPDVTPGGTIGTYAPSGRARKGREGPGPAPIAPQDVFEAVGTIASATSDHRTWTLVQSVRPDGIRIAISTRDTSGDLRWLARGIDYLYDASVGKIVLTADVTIDPETQYLFVHGVPQDRALVLRHRPIGDDVVQVVVGERRLAEGDGGYTVDRAAGRIRILDAAIQTLRMPFYVRVGRWSFGNYPNREKLKALLDK